MRKHYIHLPHLPIIELAPHTQESVNAICCRQVESLKRLLVGVTGRIFMVDDKSAIGIDKFQIKQSQQLLICQIRLVKERLDIEIGIPVLTAFSPDGLLACRRYIRLQHETLFIQLRIWIDTDAKKFGGNINIQSIVWRIITLESKHQVPAPKPGFSKCRFHLIREEIKRKTPWILCLFQPIIGCRIDILRISPQLFSISLRVA